MKKLLLIVLVLFTLGACATTGGNPPIVQDEKAQDVAITIAARNLAFFVGRNNPKIIDPAIAFCSAFSGAATVDIQPLIAQGLTYLDLEVRDYPMAKKDLETLLSLFNIQVLNADIPLTPRQIAMVKLAAVAMKEGFEFAKENPKQRSVSCSQQINT